MVFLSLVHSRRYLDLRSNGFTTVPECLWGLDRLTELALNDNDLEPEVDAMVFAITHRGWNRWFLLSGRVGRIHASRVTYFFSSFFFFSLLLWPSFANHTQACKDFHEPVEVLQYVRIRTLTASQSDFNSEDYASLADAVDGDEAVDGALTVGSGPVGAVAEGGDGTITGRAVNEASVVLDDIGDHSNGNDSDSDDGFDYDAPLGGGGASDDDGNTNGGSANVGGDGSANGGDDGSRGGGDDGSDGGSDGGSDDGDDDGGGGDGSAGGDGQQAAQPGHRYATDELGSDSGSAASSSSSPAVPRRLGSAQDLVIVGNPPAEGEGAATRSEAEEADERNAPIRRYGTEDLASDDDDDASECGPPSDDRAIGGDADDAAASGDGAASDADDNR